VKIRYTMVHEIDIKEEWYDDPSPQAVLNTEVGNCRETLTDAVMGGDGKVSVELMDDENNVLAHGKEDE
jgi:hypothetical protein